MILILDFGSQYTQLIARRIRELKVYCEIVPYSVPFREIESKNPRGLILSGGPASVYSVKSCFAGISPSAKLFYRVNGNHFPICDPEVFSGKIPVLGICYGMQLMAHAFHAKVAQAKKREFGHAKIVLEKDSPLFQNLPRELSVWMSHGDEVQTLPPNFIALAKSYENSLPLNGSLSAMAHLKLPLYGVQFHPEVAHTPLGKEIFSNFLFRICREEPSWEMQSFIENEIKNIRKQVGNQKVICALSGGVDSSVASALVFEALGTQLHCIFVDNGLLRWGEKERVQQIFGKRYGKQLHLINAEKRFLSQLKGVSDPEKKRKIIGKEFIRVFEEEAKKIGKIQFLVQGTLYPDVIESQSVKGPSAVIKTHHNVGGLPKKMKLKLIEPLKQLFKDEVRELGKKLGLPEEILLRHPFPGPGLAVRVLGAVSKEKLDLVRAADKIVEEEIRAAKIYDQLWQAFAVLLPLQTVGVMGDSRTYEQVVALRMVTSSDAMTADWAEIPKTVLSKISNRIINEVCGINRVVYDISSKPPATIEWE